MRNTLRQNPRSKGFPSGGSAQDATFIRTFHGTITLYQDNRLATSPFSKVRRSIIAFNFVAELICPALCNVLS